MPYVSIRAIAFLAVVVPAADSCIILVQLRTTRRSTGQSVTPTNFPVIVTVIVI